MNLVLLAGNSYRNKEWIYRVKEVLSPLFDKSFVLEYAHWQSGEEEINLDNEILTLSNKLINDSNYSIFAKSVGSIVALKGINDGVLKPIKIIIAGLPLFSIMESGTPFGKWLENSDVPLLIIQNTSDPLGSYLDVKKYFLELNIKSKYKIIELPGDDHSYNDLPKLKELVAEFIK